MGVIKERQIRQHETHGPEQCRTCTPTDTAALARELLETLTQLSVVGSVATGYLLADFREMHRYIEMLMGRPVWTHEMGKERFATELRNRARGDFEAAIIASQPVITKAREALAQREEAGDAE